MKKIKVWVKRVCGCVKRNELEKMQFFNTMEEAREYCENSLVILKENSCNTHHFFFEEREDDIVINSDLNTDLFSIK